MFLNTISRNNLVLEAPATKKRELENLESALKVMNIRKDSNGVQHEDVESVPKGSSYMNFRKPTIGDDATGPLLRPDPWFRALILSFAAETATQVGAAKDRDLKRRVFRYIGTVNSSGKFTNEDVQKRVADMKIDRSPIKANNLGEESKEARFAASRAEQTAARFHQMNRLRRAVHEYAQEP
jgi:hypothetical protein